MARPTNSSNELILRVRRRDGRQDEIYVAPGLTIGRSVANTVVLAGDSTVDPIQHARAEVNHDGTLCLCCRDPASTILQNGVKVSKVALEPGQQFKIGDTDFECLRATRTDKPGYENLDSSSRGCPYCHSEPVPLADSGPRCCPTCGKEVLAIENVSDNADVQFVPVTYGSFRAESFVARGGMGLVLKGRSVSDIVAVAIKLLPATRRDSASLERFQREIDLLTQIHHPNVVRLLGSGSEAGYQYLVMEWIEGETLKDKITQSFAASRLVTFDEARPWFKQICAGLMALHRKGIVHRDLKPSNVLIDGNSVARIVDLGIAKPMSETDRSLTTTGSAPGTFVYMAPEQHVAPETVDERADIYALGVTFLELLTGQLPLGAWKPVSVVNPTVPASFGDILSRAMAQRPLDRPQTIEEIFDQIPGSPALIHEVLASDGPTSQPTETDNSSLTPAKPADLDEHLNSIVPSLATAMLAGKVLAAMMPKVHSSYVPSGALPRRALCFLIAGALLSIPFAAMLCWAGIGLVDSVFVPGSSAAASPTHKSEDLLIPRGGKAPFAPPYSPRRSDREISKRTENWLVGIGMLLLLVAVVALCVGTGLTTAWITTEIGKQGKNRNTTAAGFLSVTSVVLAYGLACLTIECLSVGQLPRELWVNRGIVVSAVVSAVLAAGFAVRRVESAKFCENCLTFMASSKLPSVCLGGLKAMAHALNSGNVSAAAQVLRAASTGYEGGTVLFHCPSCERGFVELTVNYPERRDERQTEYMQNSRAWLAASVKLTPSDVAMLKPLIACKK